jgi:hypothetical protein
MARKPNGFFLEEAPWWNTGFSTGRQYEGFDLDCQRKGRLMFLYLSGQNSKLNKWGKPISVMKSSLFLSPSHGLPVNNMEGFEFLGNRIREH